MRRTLILFVLGAAILLPWDVWYTLVPGIALLLAAIVSGVFAVATPEFLTGDQGADD